MSVVRSTRAAHRDLVEITAYLAERNEKVTRRFLAEARATFNRLARMPGLGTRYEIEELALAELRYSPISKYPMYLVFYRTLPDGIEVVRVLHGSRDIAGILAIDLGIQDDEGEEADD